MRTIGHLTFQVSFGVIAFLSVPPDFPTFGAESARHYSLGGLGDLATEVIGKNNRAITGVAPCEDMDGDGREDLLVRLSDRQSVVEDRVFLVYGFDAPGGELDFEDDAIRKTVITTGLSPLELSLQYRGNSALAGGKDVDGDGKRDLLVASSYEPTADGSALLLIYGGFPANEEIDGDALGDTVRGTLITDSRSVLSGTLGRLAGLLEDLSGDGLAEVFVADPGYNSPGSPNNHGSVFVIFGSQDFPRIIDLDGIGTGELPGFRIGGPPLHLIPNVAPLGDVDGDGFSELGIVLHPSSGPRRVYLLFGSEEIPSSLALDDIPGAYGSVFEDLNLIADGGDLDGDHFGDLILAKDTRTSLDRGAVYVLYGRKRTEIPGTVKLEDFAGLQLGTMIEETSDPFSVPFSINNPRFAVAEGRDIDDDGRSDVLVSVVNLSNIYGPAGILAGGAAFFIGTAAAPPGRLPAYIDASDIPRGMGIRLDGIEPQQMVGSPGIYLLSNFEGNLLGSLLFTVAHDLCAAPFDKELKLWLLSGRLLELPAPPRVNRVLPAQGSVDGQNEAVLLGTGFGSEPEVQIGGRAARVKDVLGDGIAIVEAPPGAAGLATVKVRTEFGESSDDPTYRFTPQRTLEIGRGTTRTLSFFHEEPAAYRFRGAAVGDYDGDGLADVVVADFKQGVPGTELKILAGDGRRGSGGDIEAIAPPLKSVLRTHPERSLVAVGIDADGDLNGDGIDDLVLRMFPAEPEDGDETWLFLGRREMPAEADLKGLPGVVRLYHGSEAIRAGAAAVLPDVSGDEFKDLVLSYWIDRLQRTSLHILKGQREWPAEIDLEEAAGLGLAAHLIADISLATTCGFAGDMNLDGRPDVYFGGEGVASEGAMAIFYGDPLLFSGRTILVNSGLFGDSAGLLISGPAPASGSELSVAFPGDLNGDGVEDFFFRQNSLFECTEIPLAGGGAILDYYKLLTGLPEEVRRGLQSLYGGRLAGVPDFAPGSPGTQPGVIHLRGDLFGEDLGVKAIAAGDFDGDGNPDLLLSSPGLDAGGPATGACHLIRGGTLKDAPALLTMSDLGDRGIKLLGRGIPKFGRYIDARFDWDRDGYDDLFVAGERGQACVIFGGPEREIPFIRGDANLDTLLDLTDPVYTLSFLFLGGQAPSCPDASDSDDDGEVSVTDVIFSLNYQFLGGPRPPAPFPEAGTDPTSDDPFGCKG